jgi:hypothetical protein
VKQRKARPISWEMDGGGWVKLWRKALDSNVFADRNLWHVFSWCLLSASHTKHHVSVKTGRGNTLITLGPGQFIYGRKSLARTLRLKESTARRYMKRLERMGVIVIQPDTHFSIVTVCNWSIYQGDGGKSEHPTGHPTDTQRTGKEQATDTYKKGEKGNKGESVKNGEKAKDAAADSLSSSWKEAENFASKLEKARTFHLRNGKQRPAKESQRLDVLRACKLATDGVIAPAWLEEAATRTRDNRPEDDAYGYFLTVLRGICTDNGVDFGKAAAGVDVPEGLRRRKDRPGGRQAGDDSSNEPAHQDCAPCVPEGRDDRQDVSAPDRRQERLGGVDGAEDRQEG